MQTSRLYSLNILDIGKGFIVAAGGAAIAAAEKTIQAGSFTLNWQYIGCVALAAGLSYLLKNFFTPAKTLVDTGTQYK